MVYIVLSERDFGYELQSLVNSFFPGQKSSVLLEEDGRESDRERLQEVSKEEVVCIGIYLGMARIRKIGRAHV